MKEKKQPWPTKNAMEQVYEMHLWGGNQHRFYSGEGSHQVEIVKPYLTSVISFLTSFNTPIDICDLGCGDFNIGKNLFEYSKNYVAIDIVPKLIDFNKSLFKAENLAFQCLDIAIDELPMGDCAIVRQVLQHLSNNEIKLIIEKLYSYKYVILTEHLPNGKFNPNKDIISGQGNRLKQQSGVDLLVEPFSFKIKQAKELASVNLGKGQGKIVTILYEMD